MFEALGISEVVLIFIAAAINTELFLYHISNGNYLPFDIDKEKLIKKEKS